MIIEILVKINPLKLVEFNVILQLHIKLKWIKFFLRRTKDNLSKPLSQTSVQKSKPNSMISLIWVVIGT